MGDLSKAEKLDRVIDVIETAVDVTEMRKGSLKKLSVKDIDHDVLLQAFIDICNIAVNAGLSSTE